MLKNFDWKIITLGFAVLILVLSLFIFMGIKIFTPNDNNSNEPIVENNHPVDNNQNDGKFGDVTNKDGHEEEANGKTEDIFKNKWSESKPVTFYNSITFSPIAKVEGVVVEDTLSMLVDSYKGSFLFKADPYYLYYYDNESKEPFLIDEGINIAKIDHSNGLIYYTKTYSPEDGIYQELVYQFDPKTREGLQVGEINDFFATSLIVDKDVAMVSGFEYNGEQSINKRNYYSVFVPNFLKEGIFKKNTFILQNTNNQPHMVVDQDIFVASFDYKSFSYNVYTYSTSTPIEFTLVGSKKIKEGDKDNFSKDTRMIGNSKHVALFDGQNILIDGKRIENSQPIKQLELIGEDYLLILGESMELNLYSIKEDKFILLENDVFQFSIESNTLYIETVTNAIFATQFTTK